MAVETGQRVGWLDETTRWLETNPDLDGLASAVGTVSEPFNRQPAADMLRGTWLGHALHPLMTDLPLGCWMSAIALDLLGGNEKASQRLVGLGLLAVPLTAAAGLSEWDTIKRPEERRVTAVHAVGNTLAALAFTRSWMKRRKGQHASGKAWSLLGGIMALGTGYLGGHLSFARLVGQGHRGLPNLSPSGIRVRLVQARR